MYSPPVERALKLPSGARFFKCALQVNPYDYVLRHHKPNAFATEDDYNEALVQALCSNGVEVIAVTDHYRVATAARLIERATDAGLHVFPGFEAVTSEGVHVLCLFEPGTPAERLERSIGACGVTDDTADSPLGQLSLSELLGKVQEEWSGICIAAHITARGGVLTALSGQARVRLWQDRRLLAGALPVPLSAVDEGLRRIIRNEDSQYKRDRPIAVFNAGDITGPDSLSRIGAWSWIKMCEVTVEGLRQAFLDPESRIRLAESSLDHDHAEFVALAWEGGFLDGSAIHFNENLNVLIGGRGIKNVLRSGTKVSLLVKSYRPSPAEYLIERTVPNPPVVRSADNRVLDLSPLDVVPNVEVYGQHELSEVAKDPVKLTRVLQRFVPRDDQLEERKARLADQLASSRAELLDLQRRIENLKAELDALPGLEETLRRYQQAGVEERLKEQSLLVTEERLLTAAGHQIGAVRTALQQLGKLLPFDTGYLAEQSIAHLPGKVYLRAAAGALAKLEAAVRDGLRGLASAVEVAEKELRAVVRSWSARKESIQEEYQRILRELQKTKIDGEEYVRLRQRVESLRSSEATLAALKRRLDDLTEHRRQLVADWEDVKAQRYRGMARAAAAVNAELVHRVRLQVNFAGHRKPLFDLLRDRVGGRLNETIDLLGKGDLSLQQLARALREGPKALNSRFGIPLNQAQRLSQAGEEVFMLIEELDLEPTTEIELNVAPEGAEPVWKPMGDLSAGQKATALLLLLLLGSDAPLVVDQPEDDLDNRFISEGVVPRIRKHKRGRQFVFSTHNANVPVLGDAELIVGLRALGEADRGRAEIPVEHMGSIDALAVRELVGEVLEGGKEAFETRRLKYGF